MTDTPAEAATSSGPARKPRRHWWWIIALALIAAAGVFWYLRGHSQPAGDNPRGDAAGRSETPVVTQRAVQADVSVYINGLGTVIPLNTVTVRPRVDGQLLRVLFREGQMVKAGDLLAEIDPAPFQVQLTQAEGQLARDRAQLVNARIDLERYRLLQSQDSIASQQVDTQAALVRQLEGTVKADQGQVDSARLQLSFTRVTAPISGRLGLRQVDPGNIVHATDSNGLVVITQLQPMTVVFPIPEDSLRRVIGPFRAGEALPVEAFDRDGKIRLASGQLQTIDNQIDTTTGTVKLKAQFPNDDLALFANQFVNARLRLDVLHGATVVPSAAVQRGSQGSFAFVATADGKVSLRQVKTGAVDGERIVIENGIAAGEEVVVDGTDRLRDGARVKVVTRDTSATTDAAPPRPRREGAGKGEGRPKRGGRREE